MLGSDRRDSHRLGKKGWSMILIALAEDAKDLDVIHNQLFVTGVKLSTQAMAITAETKQAATMMALVGKTPTKELKQFVRMWNVKLNK